MRVSTEKDDPGYEAWVSDPGRWKLAKILLDGVETKRVITFDTDAGFVRVNQTDEDGNYILSGDEFATEDVYGVVTLIEPTTE